MSTNPAKYDPNRQEYDFNLDFSLVKGGKINPLNRYKNNSNENSLERESSHLGINSRLYESSHLNSGSLTQRGESH